MTSTNDEKDVKSNQTSGPKGKTYYIELYKSLDNALNRAAPLSERTEALCAAWGRVHRLCAHSANATHAHLLTWLQRHTARTILQTEWQNPESAEHRRCLDNALADFLEEVKVAVAARNGEAHNWETQLGQRAEWFRRTVPEPWGHPVLLKLIDQSGPQPSQEEVLEWLKEERGVMFATRLRQLGASKTCHDLGLALVTAVMERVRATAALEEQTPEDMPKEASYRAVLSQEAGFTTDVWELLVDLEFVLLYKVGRTSRCIELAKQTPLRSGYQLVERLRTRLEISPREKKLWKSGKDVAIIIAEVIVTRCMVTPVCKDPARATLFCCTRSLVRLLPAAKLPAEAAALAAPAATACHLHTFAHATRMQCTEEMKPFVCQLYVRAINAGVNELERLRLDTEKESEARKMEETLALWFVQLGDLLAGSPRIKCECALTAFSIHPSPAFFERLKVAPPLQPAMDKQEPVDEPKSEFGSWASDSHGQSNFVKTSETLNLKSTARQANVLSTALLAEGEALGLSAELCQDVAALLSGARLKTLSWDMDRERLLEVCRGHMERTNCGTRTLTTELRYLNLDPSQFQHLPEEDDGEGDVFYGIERGYEHLVELPEPEPEEIWADALYDSDLTVSAESSAMEQDEQPASHRKKKNRSRKPGFLSDENDPLSLTTEPKERPPSKERQIEKKEKPKKGEERSKSKIKKKRETSQERRKEMKAQKKQEKKERKKLEQDDVTPKPLTSLSSLIGLKVCSSEDLQPDLKMEKNLQKEKKKKPPIDGLRLSSESDSQVVYDGQFSMDEFKTVSPPKPQHQADVLTKQIDESASPSVGIPSPVIPAVSPAPSVHSPGHATKSPVREDVKERITKLLAFRKQKNAISSPLSSPNQSFVSESPTSSRDQDCSNSSGNSLSAPVQAVMQRYPQLQLNPLPKATSSVTIPVTTFNLPNSALLLNNSTISQPNSVNVPAQHVNNIPATVTSQRQDATAVTENNAAMKLKLPKSKPKPPNPKPRQKKPATKQTKPKGLVQAILGHKVTTHMSNIHPGQKVEDWQGLIDQMSPNVFTLPSNVPSAPQSVPKVVPNPTKVAPPKPSPSTSIDKPPPRKIYGMKDFLSILQSEYAKRQDTGVTVAPVNQVVNQVEDGPTQKTSKMDDILTLLKLGSQKVPQGCNVARVVMNLPEDEDATGRSKKHHPDAPKTFSRMIYDKTSKQKQLRQIAEQEAISNELERHIREFQKLKALQSKGSITFAKVDAKAEQPQSPAPSKSNPVLTGYLNAPSPIKFQPEAPRPNVPLRSTHLDQKEMFSLLQQQNILGGRNYMPASSPHIAHTSQYQNQPNATANKALNATVTGYVNKAPTATITADDVRGSVGDGYQNEFNKMIGQTGLLSNNKAYLEYDKEPVKEPVELFQGVFNNVGANNDDLASNTKGKSKRAPKKGKGNTIQKDLVSIMDALRAHKTPSRGPNALELALTKHEMNNKQIETKKQNEIKTNNKIASNELTQDAVLTAATPKLAVVPENKPGNPPNALDLNINRLIETEVAYQINAKNYKIQDPEKLIATVKNIFKQPGLHKLTQKVDEVFQSAKIGSSTVTKVQAKKAQTPKPQIKPVAVQKAPTPMLGQKVQNAPVDLQKASTPKAAIQKGPTQKSMENRSDKQFMVQKAPNAVPKLVEAPNGPISISKTIKIQKDVLIKPAAMPKSPKAAPVQKRTQEKLTTIQEESLLDELMDKELLEEIGELSSDDDTPKDDVSRTKIQLPKIDATGNQTQVTQRTKDKTPSENVIAVDALKAQKYVGMRVVQPKPTVEYTLAKTNNTCEKRNPSQDPVPALNIVLLRPEVNTYAQQNPVFMQGPVSSYLVNPTPNLALYQTTQYAAPVINQIIIGNATSVHDTSTMKPVPVIPVVNSGLNVVEQSDEIATISEAKALDNTVANIATYPEAKPKKKIEILEQRTLNFEYITRNKKRKVLHEVQDKQNAPPPEIPTKTDKTTVDRVKLETVVEKKVVRKDSERVKIKRLAILNREVNQRCFYPPIPLIYEPLTAARVIAKPDVAIETVLSDSLSATQNTDDNNGGIIKEVAKENTVNENAYRRILLRSSNKVKTPETPAKVAKTAGEKKPKAAPTIKAKVPSKDCCNIDKIKTPKRISKRNLNKKALLNKAEDKTVLPRTDAESNDTKKLFDVEDELLAVKIPKVELSENKEPNINPGTIQGDKSGLDIKQTTELNDKDKNTEKPETVLGNTAPKENMLGPKQSNNTANTDTPLINEMPNSIEKTCSEFSLTHNTTELKTDKGMDRKQTEIPKTNDESEAHLMKEISKSTEETRSKFLSTHGTSKLKTNKSMDTSKDETPKSNDKSESLMPKTKRVQETPSSQTVVDEFGTPLDYMQNVKINSVKVLPAKAGEPIKKCIQITLPNTNSYKVTISGAANVDINTLFANPAVKSIITSNWSQSKKYRLNIQHHPSRKEPFKVIEAEELFTVNKSSPVAKITDTIDLISDEDTDQNISQNLKTEYGIYKVASEIDYERLQSDMNRKCTVKLMKHPDSFFMRTPSVNTDEIALETNEVNITDTLLMEESVKDSPEMRITPLVEETAKITDEVVTEKANTDTEIPQVNTTEKPSQQVDIPALEAEEKVVEPTREPEQESKQAEEVITGIPSVVVAQEILKDNIIHKENDKTTSDNIVPVAREILKGDVIRVVKDDAMQLTEDQTSYNQDVIKHIDVVSYEITPKEQMYCDEIKQSIKKVLNKDTASHNVILLNGEKAGGENKPTEEFVKEIDTEKEIETVPTEHPVKEKVSYKKDKPADSDVSKRNDGAAIEIKPSDVIVLANKEKVDVSQAELAEETGKEKVDTEQVKLTEDAAKEREGSDDVVFVREEIISVDRAKLTHSFEENDASDDIEFVSEEKSGDSLVCKETSLNDKPVLNDDLIEELVNKILNEDEQSITSVKESSIVNEIDDSSNSVFPDVIEIESSSSDEEIEHLKQKELDSFIPDIEDIPDMTLLGTQTMHPEEKIIEFKNLLLNDLGVLVDDISGSCKPLTQTRKSRKRFNKVDINQVDGPKDPKLCQQCFVKLVNCDHLVEKFKVQNAVTQKKCVINLVKCDQIAEDHDSDSEIEFSAPSPNSEMNRSGSPSILNNIQWENLEIGLLDDGELEPNGRTSPVMEIFEIISRFNQKIQEDPRIVSIVKCNAEWFMTKRPVYWNGYNRIVSSEAPPPKSLVPSLLSMALKILNLVPQLPVSPSRKRKLTVTEETVVTKKSSMDIKIEADSGNSEYEVPITPKIEKHFEDQNMMLNNSVASTKYIDFMVSDCKSVEKVEVIYSDKEQHKRKEDLNFAAKLVPSMGMLQKTHVKDSEIIKNSNDVFSDLKDIKSVYAVAEAQCLERPTTIEIQLPLEYDEAKDDEKTHMAANLQVEFDSDMLELNTNTAAQINEIVSNENNADASLNLDIASDTLRDTSLLEKLNTIKEASTLIEKTSCPDIAENRENMTVQGVRETLTVNEVTEQHEDPTQNYEKESKMLITRDTMEELKTPEQITDVLPVTSDAPMYTFEEGSTLIERTSYADIALNIDKMPAQAIRETSMASEITEEGKDPKLNIEKKIEVLMTNDTMEEPKTPEQIIHVLPVTSDVSMLTTGGYTIVEMISCPGIAENIDNVPAQAIRETTMTSDINKKHEYPKQNIEKESKVPMINNTLEEPKITEQICEVLSVTSDVPILRDDTERSDQSITLSDTETKSTDQVIEVLSTPRGMLSEKTTATEESVIPERNDPMTEEPMNCDMERSKTPVQVKEVSTTTEDVPHESSNTAIEIPTAEMITSKTLERKNWQAIEGCETLHPVVQVSTSINDMSVSSKMSLTGVEGSAIISELPEITAVIPVQRTSTCEVTEKEIEPLVDQTIKVCEEFQIQEEETRDNLAEEIIESDESFVKQKEFDNEEVIMPAKKERTKSIFPETADALDVNKVSNGHENTGLMSLAAKEEVSNPTKFNKMIEVGHEDNFPEQVVLNFVNNSDDLNDVTIKNETLVDPAPESLKSPMSEPNLKSELQETSFDKVAVVVSVDVVNTDENCFFSDDENTAESISQDIATSEPETNSDITEQIKKSQRYEKSKEILDLQQSSKNSSEENEVFQESASTEEDEIQYDMNSPLIHEDIRESTPTDYAERPSIILKGIEFKDPIVGTCYIFRPIDDCISDTASVKTDLNESDLLNESIEEVDEIDDEVMSPGDLVTPESPSETTQEIKCITPEPVQNITPKSPLGISQEFKCGTPDPEESSERSLVTSKEIKCATSKTEKKYDNLHVMMPRRTYKLAYTNKTLKRKLNIAEPKHHAKRYRKGKRIDYPKLTAATMKESAFSSEYKALIDYIDTVQFSYSRPFHKNEVDVHDALSNWPIAGPVVKMEEDINDTDNLLFCDVPNRLENEIDSDPLKKSLIEELSTDLETEIAASDDSETNFNMGFGEESGRVIQNLKEGGDISKFSAATLSDVKHTQPFLLSSDDGENDAELRENIDDQKDKIIRSINYIQLKDKVRSFFAKIKLDLVANTTPKDGQKNPIDAGKVFQYVPGLYCTDFLKPEETTATINVVQVGQLPVSAAAQNPVTIDPRVTQVSDASPSQCSVENSPRSDNNQANIKVEYTELTNADLSLPLVQVISEQNQSATVKDKGSITPEQTVIPKEIEIRSELKERIDLSNEDSTSEPKQPDSIDFHYENSNTNENMSNDLPPDLMFNASTQPSEESFLPTQKQENGSAEKTDQIAHAMNAAGITTTPETTIPRPHPLVNLLSQKVIRASPPSTGKATNNYQKTSINAMALQQALAQILPPPLNQTSGSESGQQTQNATHTPQVLHIVQGKNASGQITLVDNSQQSVISTPNATQVLHIVQNKSAAGMTSNGTPNTQNFSGLSLVDTGLQQGGNQLLHIVNTGNHKNANATGQLLKRVNLLTNLTNVQGGNEQKMVQFVCKSADGKAIHLNAPHQRSMVLRLQPIETPNVQANIAKPAEQELSPTQTTNLSKDSANQQEIKSRSVYEENYAKFIQNSSTPKSAMPLEKSTSLPKFNQAFGKATFQEGAQKQNEINANAHLPQDNGEAPPPENTINLDHLNQINSPPLLVRKTAVSTSQAQQNLVQQIKQSIAPMNMTMHGGVIYTRQIPVNIGGGQTINLITVPTTELIDENGQKQQAEMETPIIKIVPQTQPSSEGNTDDNTHLGSSSENPPTPQPQQVLTQMRIKLPMLSKTPQVVQGARAVRPAFFQIQRNMIGGANQGQVYQQLVLTAAPPLGQQTIRLPQAPARQVKVQPETPSPSESQLSSSTLEQLREFDMVLEQVKERSTVQPSGSTNNNTTFAKLHTPSTDASDSNGSVTASSTSTDHTQQVLYSIGNSSTMNVAYVNRKSTVTTPTTSTYVRSPDSSGIVDSPSSSSSQLPQSVTETPSVATSTSESSSSTSQPKAAKVGSKSVKTRPKPATATPSAMTKVNNPIPPKTSTQKPLEDEQTTQRILYILAEYKEQVENSPDKDKPAPRRRSNPPSNPSGSSKRKKSSSGSRRHGCTRDHSPIGDDNCRTMGSEDSSCGTSQGDCTENCSIDAHSPQDSPRKVVRKLTFEQETPLLTQPRLQAPRNVIVADGQTITVARSATGKPTTAVLMPANYILPVSMMKGGQQIAIVTNRGPKLLTVGGAPGEAGAANALLLQRLIGPAGLKPVLARPGVRHVRLPATALHNLQAFNIQAAVPTPQPPDSTASPAPAPTPPELIETRVNTSPWAEREPTTSEVKPERGSSPEASEPWHLQASTDTPDYSYEEPVTSRADNVDRTVLVVQKKDGSTHGLHRVTHISSAALRHKYAILEHELRLQKSLSEECEDLGVDSPSASELFPEAELLFAASPAHDHSHHTPQPNLMQSTIPQPDMDDQIATDHLLPPSEDLPEDHRQLADDVNLGLGDVGIVTVSEDGSATIALDQEEFARAHPNTTFHSEPTDVGEEVQPFSLASSLAKGRHITSTIFHSNTTATVLMTAPQQTVISQTAPETSHAQTAVKYSDIDNMINSLPGSQTNELNLSSVLVKDDGLTRFDSILTDSRELHLSNTASAIVHPNVTQVIRRVCYDDDAKRDRERFLMDENDGLIAGDDAKMSVAEESSRDVTMDSMGPDDVDEDSSPERHAELFWESNSASERSESRRPLDYSSDSDKCCKSPSLDETNSTDSSGVGTHLRLDSVIKEARGRERSGSVDGSSADDTVHRPIRTYPPKRSFNNEGEVERSLSGKTRAGERSSPDSPEVRRRASNRGVVKRGCHCCTGSPVPPRPKKPRQRKPTLDFTNSN